MEQPTETESADIRRAIDRLQATLEVLGDRYRELRRERKQLRARVEELEQQNESTEIDTTARLETAAADRKHAIELEECVVQAEKRNAELHDRQRELELRLAERESFIVEQEETIGSLRTRIDADQQRAEQEQSDELQRQISVLQSERGRLEEQQHQLISKLDASTRDAGLARTRVAELEAQLQDARERTSELEVTAITAGTSLGDAGKQRAALELERDQALDMAARKEIEVAESARKVELLQDKLDKANQGAELLQARCDELRAAIDQHSENGLSKSEHLISDSDRRDMAEQIQEAIRLIDRHLEET